MTRPITPEPLRRGLENNVTVDRFFVSFFLPERL
jgi:hypothetical protein